MLGPGVRPGGRAGRRRLRRLRPQLARRSTPSWPHQRIGARSVAARRGRRDDRGGGAPRARVSRPSDDDTRPNLLACLPSPLMASSAQAVAVSAAPASRSLSPSSCLAAARSSLGALAQRLAGRSSPSPPCVARRPRCRRHPDHPLRAAADPPRGRARPRRAGPGLPRRSPSAASPRTPRSPTTMTRRIAAPASARSTELEDALVAGAAAGRRGDPEAHAEARRADAAEARARVHRRARRGRGARRRGDRPGGRAGAGDRRAARRARRLARPPSRCRKHAVTRRAALRRRRARDGRARDPPGASGAPYGRIDARDPRGQPVRERPRPTSSTEPTPPGSRRAGRSAPPDPADRFDVARLTAPAARPRARRARLGRPSGVDDVLVEVSEHGLRMRENVVVRDAARRDPRLGQRARPRRGPDALRARRRPRPARRRVADAVLRRPARVGRVGQARAVGAGRGLDVQQIDTGAFADDERQHALAGAAPASSGSAPGGR